MQLCLNTPREVQRIQPPPPALDLPAARDDIDIARDQLNGDAQFLTSAAAIVTERLGDVERMLNRLIPADAAPEARRAALRALANATDSLSQLEDAIAAEAGVGHP